MKMIQAKIKKMTLTEEKTSRNKSPTDFSPNLKWQAYQRKRLLDIVNEVKKHFMEYGAPITYDELSANLKTSKSNLSRYKQLLIKTNMVEVYETHFYPVGFRQKIMEMAQKEFEDVSKTIQAPA